MLFLKSQQINEVFLNSSNWDPTKNPMGPLTLLICIGGNDVSVGPCGFCSLHTWGFSVFSKVPHSLTPQTIYPDSIQMISPHYQPYITEEIFVSSFHQSVK